MKNKKKKNILITGAAGFIGSNLVRFLFEKYPQYQIAVIDALTYAGDTDNFPQEIWNSPRFQFHYGDIRNATLVDALVKQADIVVHMAAETHVTRSINDNLIFFETDVLGTQSVTNAVLRNRETVERLIHVSTSEVYGTALNKKMDEDHPIMPLSPYASAKAGADRLVWSYWATYKIPAVIVRPFNNYGPQQHLEKLIPRFITSCIVDEPLTIHGDGKAQRDWIYVEDTCRALDKVIHANIKKVQGEVINVGTGKSCDINLIAKSVLNIMDRPKDMVSYIDNRPGQVFRHTASIQKAKKLLGWEPKVSFEEGLKRSIAWYQDNSNWWKKRVWLRHIPIINTEGKRILH